MWIQKSVENASRLVYLSVDELFGLLLSINRLIPQKDSKAYFVKLTNLPIDVFHNPIKNLIHSSDFESVTSQFLHLNTIWTVMHPFSAEIGLTNLVNNTRNNSEGFTVS